jgi:hypothetical protein
VHILQHYSKLLGMTYEALNVWLFVFLEPLFILLLIVLLIRQQLKLRKFRKTNRL